MEISHSMKAKVTFDKHATNLRGNVVYRISMKMFLDSNPTSFTSRCIITLHLVVEDKAKT